MTRGSAYYVDGKGLAKKDALEADEATEDDPLLSSNNRGGRIPPAQHYSGSIRARRSSRSPSTTSMTMDSRSAPNQQQKGPANDRYGTYQKSSEQGGHGYRDNASQASSSLSHIDGASQAAATPNQQIFQQQFSPDAGSTPDGPSEGLFVDDLEEQPPSRKASHPSLLEIPEEIYSVRKAALQVLKPLTSSWVSLANYRPAYLFAPYVC
jgi:hypothetical protein